LRGAGGTQGEKRVRSRPSSKTKDEEIDFHDQPPTEKGGFRKKRKKVRKGVTPLRIILKSAGHQRASSSRKKAD